jgi:hypothetical protein
MLFPTRTDWLRLDRMSLWLAAWTRPEPGYFVVPICASAEARTAMTWHASPES